MRPGTEVAGFPSHSNSSRCPSPMPPAPPLGNSGFHGAPGGTWPGGGGSLPRAGPPALTQGIPDPDSIARQKDAYLKMLDDQLKQGITVLDQQVKYQRDYLNVQCDQQKKHFLLQLDQQMKAQEMTLTQQYNEQLMALQMQAGTQKAALEQQAMQLAMEYEQRKAEEHMYRQQYELHQKQTDMAVKMASDLQRIAGPSGSVPGQPGPCTAGPHASQASRSLGFASYSHIPPPGAPSNGGGACGARWPGPPGACNGHAGLSMPPAGGSYSASFSPPSLGPLPSPLISQQSRPMPSYSGVPPAASMVR